MQIYWAFTCQEEDFLAIQKEIQNARIYSPPILFTVEDTQWLLAVPHEKKYPSLPFLLHFRLLPGFPICRTQSEGSSFWTSWAPETQLAGAMCWDAKQSLRKDREAQTEAEGQQAWTWSICLAWERIGLPRCLSARESPCRSRRSRTCRRSGFHPCVRNIPWRRKWQPTPVFLPGESQGQRSLAGYSPLGLQRVGHDWATEHTLREDQDKHIIQSGCTQRENKAPGIWRSKSVQSSGGWALLSGSELRTTHRRSFYCSSLIFPEEQGLCRWVASFHLSTKTGIFE